MLLGFEIEAKRHSWPQFDDGRSKEKHYFVRM